MPADSDTARLLGRVVERVLAHRGRSPESLAQKYRPDQPPLSASAVRRIIDGRDTHLEGRDGELKLLRLSGMLDLPMGTLPLVHEGNVAELRKLDFKGEEDVRHFIVAEMQAAKAPPRQRRASDKRTG